MNRRIYLVPDVPHVSHSHEEEIASLKQRLFVLDYERQNLVASLRKVEEEARDQLLQKFSNLSLEQLRALV